MVIGHGRHGKDTVGELLQSIFFLPFKSSSQACSELFIFDTLRVANGYNTPEECYEDRHNHREEWFKLISDFNKPDYTRLARAIYAENEIYVGMRNIDELRAVQKYYGTCMHTVWVDASRRLPLEDKASMNIPKEMADSIIDNNGGHDSLRTKVISWAVKHAIV